MKRLATIFAAFALVVSSRAQTTNITGIVSTGKFLRVANPGTNVWTNRVDIFIGGVQ